MYPTPMELIPHIYRVADGDVDHLFEQSGIELIKSVQHVPGVHSCFIREVLRTVAHEIPIKRVQWDVTIEHL